MLTHLTTHCWQSERPPSIRTRLFPALPQLPARVAYCLQLWCFPWSDSSKSSETRSFPVRLARGIGKAKGGGGKILRRNDGDRRKTSLFWQQWTVRLAQPPSVTSPWLEPLSPRSSMSMWGHFLLYGNTLKLRAMIYKCQRKYRTSGLHFPTKNYYIERGLS